MALRCPRRGNRTATAAARLAVVVGAAVLAATLAGPVGAQPAPDLARARELYQSAEAAMREGRFDDAARDYGASYEASKDPALFFKIGHANERGGRCDVALSYYGRYLREGHPTERFIASTRERIVACGGDVNALEGGAVEPRRTGSGGSAIGRDPGSAAAGSATGDAPAAGSATIDVPATGSAAPVTLVPSNSHKVAWIMTGGAVALAALGGVLAYAASSSENDVRDLYAGLGGQPPAFDAQTKQRYGDLLDQGRRYQHLSWASFGLAGAAAAGAALLFAIGGRPEAPGHARVTPTVTTRGAGVAVTF
jgi:hypothetical protein